MVPNGVFFLTVVAVLPSEMSLPGRRVEKVLGVRHGAALGGLLSEALLSAHAPPVLQNPHFSYIK